MNGTQIVQKWLESKEGEKITYLEVQNELPIFARKFTDHYYTPDSWTRYFRWAKNGLQEIEGKYKTWLVLPKETLFG